MKQIDENMEEYWGGPKNFLVRMYAYLQIGFQESNNTKVVVAGIWGLYLLVNPQSIWWVFWVAIICIPVLIFVGRFKLYKVSKPAEYMAVMKGTVLKYDNFNNQIRQTELLEEILKELRK